MTDDLENAKERIRKFMQHRNRHSSHNVGDFLYYRCKDIQDWRKGTVYTVVPHYCMNYYVLDVQTGPPINESFLVMISEFNVRAEHEVDNE